MKNRFKTSTTRLLPVTVALLALGGCAETGSSSSEGGGASAKTVFAETAKDTLASRFKAEKETTFEAKAKLLIRDYSGRTVSGGMSEVSMKVIPVDGVDAKSNSTAASETAFKIEVSMGDETVTFTQDDIKAGTGGYVLTKNIDGQEISIWNYTGPWASIAEGNEEAMYTKYAMPIGFYADTSDTAAMDGATVIGMETPASALEGKAKATYNGSMWARAYEASSPSGKDRINIEGDVTLNADFANAKVGGKIDNMKFSDSEGEWDSEDDGYWEIVEGDIKGNGFSTTLKTVDEDDPGFTNSEFEGKFYGPEGEEAGGTLAFETTGGDGNNYLGSGAWVAKQQDAAAAE